MARRKRYESMDNVSRVTNGKNPEATAQMGIVMADAVRASEDNGKHVDGVNKELKKAAAAVTPRTPDKKVTAELVTEKLTLREDLPNFSMSGAVDGRANKFYDDDGKDDHLDYDMFDFVYGLVTDCWPKPLNPIKDVKHRKFMYMGSDNYNSRPEDPVGSPENTEIVEIPAFDQHAQVSSTGNTITVYANDDFDKKGNNLGPRAFDWIRQVCELYKFKYSGPNVRRNRNTHWKYYFDIHVPCISGYPMMVEDYFETLGLEMEDVMDADFCKQYRKKQAKEQAEAQKYVSDAEVNKLVSKAITAAAQDNSEPLEAHLKRLYSTLDAAKLPYQKSKVKKAFMDAFDDEEEDE